MQEYQGYKFWLNQKLNNRLKNKNHKIHWKMIKFKIIAQLKNLKRLKNKV